MTLADVVILVVLVAALVAGLRAGLFAGLGWLCGLIAGGAAAPWVTPLVNDAIPDPGWRGLAVVGTTIGLLALGAAVGGAIGSVVRRGADRMRLRVVERLLGGALGAVAAALALSLAGSGIAAAGIPGVSASVASSAVLRTIDRLTPAPVAEALARLHSTVLEDTLPTIGGLFEAGTTPDTAEIDTDDPDLAASAASVARITGVAYACGTSSSGSGFVAADDLVITNAHVVAGVDVPVVELPGEPAREGRVVYFDPVDDLAAIAVDVDAAPLAIVETLSAGSAAAVQGYPYGGPFRTVPAGVLAVGSARVADIYESARAPREVYTLSAEVVPGNSGGPLLTESGEVAGVVFARDEARADVGYAMTANELMPVFAVIGDAPEPVSTGTCIG
ncbi:MarP family serine protease [Microbacterium betulae]|uniref:MarP family serine protease n=1 Tax=Microbacterium betulae TaxID=2981139 RepID=A0AA97I7S4_9MICO|nr:MarP family serine protease [Microbacterium sp. AB]WOF23942.1 MarP family serine protease [Microbacterium sp. AB]